MTQTECMALRPNRRDAFKDYILDYSLEAPIEKWPDKIVHDCLDAALTPSKINIEVASLILSHLKETDGDYQKAANNILRAGIKPITWLKGVRTRIKNLEKSFNLT
jgi:hypothetical protein